MNGQRFIIKEGEIVIDKIYRCGYCGCPVNEDGSSIREIVDGEITVEEYLEKYKDVDVEQIQGNGCCDPREDERQMVQVTGDMAIDGDCPEMEGAWIEW